MPVLLYLSRILCSQDVSSEDDYQILGLDTTTQNSYQERLTSVKGSIGQLTLKGSLGQLVIKEVNRSVNPKGVNRSVDPKSPLTKV